MSSRNELKYNQRPRKGDFKRKKSKTDPNPVKRNDSPASVASTELETEQETGADANSRQFYQDLQVTAPPNISSMIENTSVDNAQEYKSEHVITLDTLCLQCTDKCKPMCSCAYHAMILVFLVLIYIAIITKTT